jgi:hypothetical protein
MILVEERIEIRKSGRGFRARGQTKYCLLEGRLRRIHVARAHTNTHSHTIKGRGENKAARPQVNEDETEIKGRKQVFRNVNTWKMDS